MKTEEFKQVVRATIKEMYAVSEFTKNQKVIKFYKYTADKILYCYEDYLTGEDISELDDIQDYLTMYYLTMNFSDFKDYIEDDDIEVDTEDYKEYVHCASMIFYRRGLLF